MYFHTNKVQWAISSCLGMVCSSVAGLENNLQHMNVIWKWCLEEMGKKHRSDTGCERCIWPFSWPVCCWLKSLQKSSPWKGGCQEALSKEGKQAEKGEVCAKWYKNCTENQWPQESGVMLKDNGTTGSQHPREIFGMSIEDDLKRTQESYLRVSKFQFSLSIFCDFSSFFQSWNIHHRCL